MTEEKRSFIETFLPIDEISEEAKIEKQGNAKPPISALHYWWTRKPLITARAAVLGSLLLEDFDKLHFKKLLGLGMEGRAHNYDLSDDQIANLKIEYLKRWGTIPEILDPFSGGGSIPFETMRLGINTIANDYNPLAHLIEKATFEYPHLYGETLYRDVETGLKEIFNETKQELAQYYPKHNGNDVVAYLWAWSIICPDCGFDNPIVGLWELVIPDI